jgi:hypothetical protein
VSSKYGNIPQRVDGIFFHSKKEARHYKTLKAMQQAGIIRDLETQPVFRLEVNGVFIAKYISDFRYWDIELDREIICDVKGHRTQLYKIKKRLMKAIHGIEVEEV